SAGHNTTASHLLARRWLLGASKPVEDQSPNYLRGGKAVAVRLRLEAGRPPSKQKEREFNDIARHFPPPSRPPEVNGRSEPVHGGTRLTMKSVTLHGTDRRSKSGAANGHARKLQGSVNRVKY